MKIGPCYFFRRSALSFFSCIFFRTSVIFRFNVWIFCSIVAHIFWLSIKHRADRMMLNVLRSYCKAYN